MLCSGDRGAHLQCADRYRAIGQQLDVVELLLSRECREG